MPIRNPAPVVVPAMAEIRITRRDLEDAARQGVIEADQVDTLWASLTSSARARSSPDAARSDDSPHADGAAGSTGVAHPVSAPGEHVDPGTRPGRTPSAGPRFDLAHVAYYVGALVILVAMGWFLIETWALGEGAAVAVLGAIYAGGFAWAGMRLRATASFAIPGGLLVTIAVCMVAVILHGLQRMLGLWPDEAMDRAGAQVVMMLGTAAVGIVALRRVRFPFLVAPIAVAIWIASMDLAVVLTGDRRLESETRAWTTLLVGLGMLATAYRVDRRTREDFAFWGYLFGLFAFWFGVMFGHPENELVRFVQLLVNLALIVLSVLLQRRAFVAFGAVGVFMYLAHLAGEVFGGSILFTLVLTLLGIGIMAAGVFAQKNESRIDAVVTHLVPDRARALLPTHRESLAPRVPRPRDPRDPPAPTDS